MKARLITVLVITAIAAVLAQGPLAPPPGVPAPVMKTLDQIEPRTPISSLPFIISAPGSYYFAGNLHFPATTGNAITITADNVTLDLNGFTLSSSAAVTGNAIHIVNGHRNIEVKNGVIAGTTTVTAVGTPVVWTVALGGFGAGVLAQGTGVTNCLFRHLRISGCRAAGLDAGNGAIVEQVTVRQNGGLGISAVDGTVLHSHAILNGSDGITANTVAQCIARHNDGEGIIGDIVTNCTASRNRRGFLVFRGALSGSVAHDNNSTGIQSNSSSVLNSQASENGNNGINALNAVIAFCVSAENGGLAFSSAGSTLTGNFPAE